MPSLHDLLPSRIELPAAHRPLLAFAAIVAVSLLSFYVHLLHESMALGEQMRERQRNSASLGTARPVSQRAPVALVPSRTSAGGGDARSR